MSTVGLNWALKDKQDMGERMRMKEGIFLSSAEKGACVSVPEAGLSRGMDVGIHQAQMVSRVDELYWRVIGEDAERENKARFMASHVVPLTR